MTVSLWALEGLPEVRPGDPLPDFLQEALARSPGVEPGDMLVVAQKIVSKAEGRLFPLAEVVPGPEALALAARSGKDPRIVELVLRESIEILREERGVLIARTREGFICANAGLDLSNVDGGRTACLLPLDCDGSAQRLHHELSGRLGFSLPVVISDSFGRPWRHGITNVALGAAGFEPLIDLRGQKDAHGLELRATVMALADSVAAATDLVMGKSDGAGAVVVRGVGWSASAVGGIRETLRPIEECFFR